MWVKELQKSLIGFQKGGDAEVKVKVGIRGTGRQAWVYLTL
jgi:hypothetical protein